MSNPDEILSAEEHSALDAILAAIEDSTTVQIAVVIVQSIGSENPKMFATALFEHWGIGRADKDNGLLILSVLDRFPSSYILFSSLIFLLLYPFVKRIFNCIHAITHFDSCV